MHKSNESHHISLLGPERSGPNKEM
jgi:hypothetical protein